MSSQILTSEFDSKKQAPPVGGQKLLVPSTFGLSIEVHGLMDDNQQHGRPQGEQEQEFEDSFLGKVFAQAAKKPHNDNVANISHGERSTFGHPVRSVPNTASLLSAGLMTVPRFSRTVVPSAIGFPVEAEPVSSINEIPVVDVLGCEDHHPTTRQRQLEQGTTFASTDPSHKRKKMIGPMTVVLIAAITGAIAGSVSSHKSGKGDDGGQIMASKRPVSASSNFEVASLDGWTLGDSGIALEWNVGGYILGSNSVVAGESWYFVAPSVPRKPNWVSYLF